MNILALFSPLPPGRWQMPRCHYSVKSGWADCKRLKRHGAARLSCRLHIAFILNLLAYDSLKAALNSVTLEHTKELRDTSIKINAVDLGHAFGKRAAADGAKSQPRCVVSPPRLMIYLVHFRVNVEWLVANSRTPQVILEQG